AFSAIALASGLTCAIAFILSIPLLRVHGHYLAVATFTVSLACEAIFFGAQDITGGTAGIAGISPFSLLGSPLSPKAFYAFAWIVCGIALMIFIALATSHSGRAWRAWAVREDVARSLGIRTERLKVAAFITSAVFGSISASLYASFTSYMRPD